MQKGLSVQMSDSAHKFIWPAEEAMAKAQVLALRVFAERLEHNETGSQAISIAELSLGVRPE